MKTLIITGGMIEADFALSFIQKLKPDYILGVDKGLQFCYEYDIRPDYIVGDFDSLPGEILERYRQEGSRGLQSADIKGSMGEKSTGMDRGQQK